MITEQSPIRPIWQRISLQSFRNAPVRLWDMLREPSNWKQRPWADRVVFICGCGHSGTTLALRILGAHPHAYAVDHETGAFLIRESQWSKLRRLRIAVQASGKRILIEKTPRHVRYLPRIRRSVPDARFVVLVRDGRDVAASIARRFDGNFQHGVDRWIADSQIVARESNAGDLMWVKYEDLITSPVDVMMAVCSFLDIAYDDAMLRYYQQPVQWQGASGHTRDDPAEGDGHRERRAQQANLPIFDGRGLWKDELPAEIVRIFMEGEAAPLMKRFGYI